MREGLLKGCTTPAICGGPKKGPRTPKGPVLKDLGPYFCGGPGGWEGYDFHFAHLKFVGGASNFRKFSNIFDFFFFFRNSFRNFSKSFETKIFENFRKCFDFFRKCSKIFENGVLQPLTAILRIF